ncbi:hypothetical protein ACFYXQ_03855 [Nocardia jiangxiensis]|uniref:Uncharacterized protein n=1 Tax=Nocardia jiangxiensis TaxID=282685 RepID=A0ABW6RSD4_9NOCA
MQKIQDRNCELGVLVAANGVTGNADDRKSAYWAATCALNQGIEILLLRREDLIAVRSGDDVVLLLHERRRLLKSTTTFPDPRRALRNSPAMARHPGQLTFDTLSPDQLELF